MAIASLQDEEFLKAAKEIKERCMRERKEFEVEAAASNMGLMGMINAAMHQGSSSRGWQRVSVAVDSGAAETVIPYS